MDNTKDSQDNVELIKNDINICYKYIKFLK